MDIDCAPRTRVAYTLSVVDRSRIYEEVLYSFIWPGDMLCWSNHMSSDGVVFLSQNVMVSTSKFIMHPGRENGMF